MCAGHGQPPRPSLRSAWRNLTDADLPLGDRLRAVGDNLLRRARHRQNCCGSYGEPGC